MLYSQNNNNNDAQGLLSVGWQTVDLLETVSTRCLWFTCQLTFRQGVDFLVDSVKGKLVGDWRILEHEQGAFHSALK